MRMRHLGFKISERVQRNRSYTIASDWVAATVDPVLFALSVRTHLRTTYEPSKNCLCPQTLRC